MKRKPLIMMKKTLSLIVSAALLAGCATAAKHKKGDDWTEFGKMFHQDMKESGDRIQKQLELLNETSRTKGKSAEYVVPHNNNVKEITPDDVDLMIEKGITTNHVPVGYDMPSNPQPIKSDEPQPVVETTVKQEVRKEVVDRFRNRQLSRVNLNGQKIVESPYKKQMKAPKASINKAISLNGSHNTTELVKMLAHEAGYEFKLSGEDRKIEMIIAHFNGSIKDALIGVGNGLGNRALIRVNTKNKTVVLEYK